MFTKKMIFMVLFIAAVFLAGISGTCWAQAADKAGDKKIDVSSERNAPDQDADKTGAKRDRSPESMSADQQDDRGETYRSSERISADQPAHTGGEDIDVSSERNDPDQDADNTGINIRDRSSDRMTADQQGQSKEDREMTQQIRKAVVDDKSLSTYGRNVKIITLDGTVTLRGPVRSEDEKRAIEEKARQIAGQDKIKSEIEIAPTGSREDDQRHRSPQRISTDQPAGKTDVDQRDRSTTR